jgi:acetyl-CoA/propionyl-CoA carboxylase biotin carboxyl carrier protein
VTLVGFHRALLSTSCFIASETCRGVVESEDLAKRAKELDDQLSHMRTRVAARSDGGPAGTRERLVAVEVDGRRHEIRLHTTAPPWTELARRHKDRSQGLTGEATRVVVSPMQGLVLAVAVAEGDRIEAGGLICVVEAMKMENEIVAHRDGVVTELGIAPGQQVAHGQPICVIEDA